MTAINKMTMKKFTNEEIAGVVINRIKSKITDYYPELRKEQISIQLKWIEVRDWSFIFSFDIFNSNNNKVKMVYVKIPKQDRNIFSIGSILDNKEVQNRACGEYITLRKLAVSQSDSSTLQVIHPLDYFDDLNAIVLEGFSGRNLYLLLQANTKNLSKEQPQNLLYNCGKWLATVHSNLKNRKTGDFAKEKFYQTLKQYNYPINQIPKIYRKIRCLTKAYCNRYQNDFYYAKMLDGFEIRNILIGDQGARIIDLYEKEGFPYDDIARFVISIKILYWGTPWFVFKRQPNAFYIKSFISGYCSVLNFSNSVFRLFLLKEILRQYSNAYLSLTDKKLSNYTKKVISKLYIDRFYITEIKKIIRLMEYQ